MRFYLAIIFIVLLNITGFSQTKVYDIGFLLDKSSNAIDKALINLESEIKAVIGEDAIIQFSDANRLINNFNEELALQQYQTLLNNDTDIIIAFGTLNNLVLSRQSSFPKPTILFGNVSQDIIDKPHFNNLTAIENFIAIITPQSYEEDLVLLKELANPSRVGVLIEESFINYSGMAVTVANLESKLDLDLELISFTTVDDILNNLDNVDAVYLLGGYYFSDSDVVKLADALIERKIPSFTTTPMKDVELGLLATNQDRTEINQFFRRIALNVESIINDKEFTDISSLLDLNERLTININTANKIGLPLKYSLIVKTNIVGDATELVADKEYTLFDVMQEAIAENLRLKTNQQDVLISEKDTELAKSEYLPDVFVSATGNYVDPELAETANGQRPEWSSFSNVTLNQTVYSQFASANITIQKALQQAQQENYNSEELNTVFSASAAYFNALVNKANYKVQTQNLDLTKTNLRIATHNFEAGLTGKSDVLRFKSELTQNIQAVIVALNNMDQGFYALNRILNNPIDYKIDVKDTELLEGTFEGYVYKQLALFLDSPELRKTFVNFLIQEALENSPELKSLDYNLIATERAEKLYGVGRFIPTVALQGQYNYTFNRAGAGSTFPTFFTPPPDGYYYAGLSLSLPVFNQNKQNINKQIAEIQSDQINFSKDDLKLRIEKNVNDAILQLVNEISNIELSKVFEETAKEALELTQVSYANGAVNIVQLLDAQNNFLEAQLSVSTATYDYLFGLMELERYLGTFFLLQTNDEQAEFLQRFLEYTNNN